MLGATTSVYSSFLFYIRNNLISASQGRIFRNKKTPQIAQVE